MTNPQALSDAVEPCPWCGKAPVHDHTMADGVRFTCVACEEATFDDFTQAAEHWNRRAALAQAPRGWREAIARIVDPEAYDPNRRAGSWDGEEWISRRKQLALAKADAILASLAVPSGPVGVAAHLPSQEWLSRHVESDPDLDVEAGPVGLGGREARDTTKLPARDLTDEEMNAEEARVGAIWDEMMGDPEFEGHGGSPGEWMSERFDEIATERKRRAALKATVGDT